MLQVRLVLLEGLFTSGQKAVLGPPRAENVIRIFEKEIDRAYNRKRLDQF